MATAELQRLMFLDSAATAEDDLPLQVSRGLRYVPDVKMFDDKQNALRKKRELHSMERWLHELKHPDSYLRANALVELSAFGRDALCHHALRLAAYLVDKDTHVRVGTLRLFQQFVGRSDIIAIDRGDHYRQTVLDTVLAQLQKMLVLEGRKAEKSAEVRAEALRTVGALEVHLRPVFKKQVLLLLDDPDPFVRQAAIDTLCKIGHRTPSEIAPSRFAQQNKRVLVDKLSLEQEPCSGVRLKALGVLTKMPGAVQTSCATDYVAMLDDPSRRVRIAAGRAVQSLDGAGILRAERKLRRFAGGREAAEAMAKTLGRDQPPVAQATEAERRCTGGAARRHGPAGAEGTARAVSRRVLKHGRAQGQIAPLEPTARERRQTQRKKREQERAAQHARHAEGRARSKHRVHFDGDQQHQQQHQHRHHHHNHHQHHNDVHPDHRVIEEGANTNHHDAEYFKKQYHNMLHHEGLE